MGDKLGVKVGTVYGGSHVVTCLYGGHHVLRGSVHRHIAPYGNLLTADTRRSTVAYPCPVGCTIVATPRRRCRRSG